MLERSKLKEEKMRQEKRREQTRRAPENCTAQYTVRSAKYTVHSTQCTIHIRFQASASSSGPQIACMSHQCAVHGVQFTVYTMQYTGVRPKHSSCHAIGNKTSMQTACCLHCHAFSQLKYAIFQSRIIYCNHVMPP